MQQDGMLVFHPSCNDMFIKNYCESKFVWNGSDIGEISSFVNRIPALKSKKIFYLFPAQQYISLEPYTVLNHYIECIKPIFGIRQIPFNICTYKSRKYIMYVSYPEYETIYSLMKKKPHEITDEERKIYLFHWILGVRGKYMRVRTTSGYFYFSRASYGSVNLKRNDISKSAVRLLFGTLDVVRRNFNDYINEDNIYKLRCLLETHNYNWFYDINSRIYLFVYN